jgi:hypothetical protein
LEWIRLEEAAACFYLMENQEFLYALQQRPKRQLF